MDNNTTTQTESRPLLRRLGNWTRYAFSPTFPMHGTALSAAIAEQNETYRPNRSTPMTDRIRRVLRRLDSWTLTVFNPYYPSDHRR